MSKNIALHVDCNGLGDTISATPTLRKLSYTYNQKISIFTKYIDVFKNHPLVDKVYHLNEFKANKSIFDIIHNTFNNLLLARNHLDVEFKHNIIDIRQYHAIATGFMLTPDEMNCDFYPDPYVKINNLPDKYVVIHPTSTWPSRTWGKEKWQELINELEKKSIPVIAVGQDSSEQGFFYVDKPTFDIKINYGINLINELNLSQLYHVLDKALYVITMDSGILHLAGCSQNVNIVQLGSSINPYFRAPYRKGKQDYKYNYLVGSCKLFCASDMKYGLEEHGTIHGVPPIINCLEKKSSFECHPTVNQVLESLDIKKVDITVIPKFDTRDKKKILFLAPHLSTGGMPEFLRKRIEALKDDLEIKVAEWTFYGSAYVVQRNQIIDLIGEENVITLGQLDEDNASYIKNRMKLFDIINDFKPDYIHVDEVVENFDFKGFPKIIADKLFNENRNYKIFETLHTSRFDAKNLKWLPDKLFLVSDWFVDNFETGVEKTSICYPIEARKKPDRSTILRRLDLDPSYKHILNVGLFTEGKNQGHVFEVAKYLTDQKIQFHFVGNQASNFENYWGPIMKDKPNNCKIWGERNDVNDFYASMDLLIFPSLNEASPLVLKEALSYNMPILYNYLDIYGDDFKLDNVFELTMEPENDAGILEAILETTGIIPPLKIPEKFSLENWRYKHLKEYDDATKHLFKKSIKITDKINYSFLDGPRVDINGNDNETYIVKFIDDNRVLYETVIFSNYFAACSIKYYKKWKIEIYKGIRDDEGQYERDEIHYSIVDLIDEYVLDLKDKDVYVSFESKSIGDTIAWIPYIEQFRKKHNCNIICSTFHNYLFEKSYSEIKFIQPNLPIKTNIVYRIGWFLEDIDINEKAPCNPESVALQKLATETLGLDFVETKPILDFSPGKRPIEEKYICLAHHSTANAKHWHYPMYKGGSTASMTGWQILVDKLKSEGYKIMVIQKEATPLKGIINECGNMSLMKRLNQLYHAEYFIGVGSGLSWLNWAIGKKTVMISGFSEPWCEFQSDNIRVINKNVCHGCFNRYTFDRGNWNWCPVHENTERQFECTTTITPEDVLNAIKADEYDDDFYTINSKDVKVSLKKPNPDAYNESDAFIYNEIFRNKEYETDKCKINKGDIVVDLGANIGIFSRYAWMRGASKVFAFEPELNNYELLCKNNPDSNNYHEALSSYDGELDLHIDSTVGGHSILEIDINKTRTGELQKVKCRTLDSVFEEGLFEKIDFLKVDTEGAEVEIFKGLSDENLNKINRISMEYHHLVFNFDEDFKKEFLSRFVKVGFKIFVKVVSNHLQYVYMHRE